MPELPEVETVRRILEKHVIGKKISSVTCYYEPIIHENLNHFKSVVIGQTIRSMARYGKHLVFLLDTSVMIIHLRMEGKFYIKKNEPKLKHEHVIFGFEDSSTLRYHDVRKFGTIHLRTLENYQKTYPLSEVGPEPKDADYKQIYELLHRKHIAIKTALLDQHIVSGLGNIYVDESLFLSAIKPTRMTDQLTKKDVKSLLESATKVLARAIALGGSTIRSYTASLGVHGRFQNELNVHTKAGQPCSRCGSIIVKTKVGGRGTYACPTCQR